MKNPFVPNERMQLPRAMKNFLKLTGLRLFSHIHPKVLKILIRVFQQSAGFGFDSGLKNETKQFANEVLKFNLETPVILDVGANIGDWSLEIDSLISDCIIHAFEPAEETFLALTESTQESANIHIHQIALGSENGFKKLFYDEMKSGKASLSMRNLKHINLDFDKSENVVIRRLDSFLEQNSLKPDFIKIDVEGHELSVLEGLGTLIKELKVIQFEFGGTDIDSRVFFQDFWKFFEREDFDLYRLTPKGKLLVNSYSENDEVFSFTTYFAITRLAELTAT